MNIARILDALASLERELATFRGVMERELFPHVDGAEFRESTRKVLAFRLAGDELSQFLAQLLRSRCG